MEDYLRGLHIAEADWPLQVPLLFRGDAMRWYTYLRKWTTSIGKKLTWSEIKTELRAKYDSPLRVESLRNDLRNIPYKGNLLRYAASFREIETQIPESDMMYGDRLANFLARLPAEHAREIRREKPTNVA